MKTLTLAALLLLPIAAMAQPAPQPTPQGTPLEQALSQRLNQEMNEAIGLQTQLIQIERDLASAKTKIADLEKKLTDKAPVAH